jgi:cytochrome c5
MTQLLKRALMIVLAFGACGSAVGETDRLEDGKKVYEAHCARCHENGNLGAPKSSDPSGWDPRSDLWDAVLAEHAENGYVDMPARGGASGATDYDVDVAVEYLMSLVNPDRAPD